MTDICTARNKSGDRCRLHDQHHGHHVSYGLEQWPQPNGVESNGTREDRIGPTSGRLLNASPILPSPVDEARQGVEVAEFDLRVMFQRWANNGAVWRECQAAIDAYAAAVRAEGATFTTVELNSKPVAALCAINDRCSYDDAVAFGRAEGAQEREAAERTGRARVEAVGINSYEVDELHEQLAALRASLKLYGWHTRDCQSNHVREDEQTGARDYGTCDCGFDAAIEGV